MREFKLMTTSQEENDPSDGDNAEEPILNKLVKPQVKPSSEGIEEENEHSGEHHEEEQTLPPGMPPLF
jgi:hypothetical protein